MGRVRVESRKSRRWFRKLCQCILIENLPVFQPQVARCRKLSYQKLRSVTNEFEHLN